MMRDTGSHTEDASKQESGGPFSFGRKWLRCRDVAATLAGLARKNIYFRSFSEKTDVVCRLKRLA